MFVASLARPLCLVDNNFTSFHITCNYCHTTDYPTLWLGFKRVHPRVPKWHTVPVPVKPVPVAVKRPRVRIKTAVLRLTPRCTDTVVYRDGYSLSQASQPILVNTSPCFHSPRHLATGYVVAGGGFGDGGRCGGRTGWGRA